MNNNMNVSDLIYTLKSAYINPRTCSIRSISFCTIDKNTGRIKVSKWRTKRKRELEFHSKDSVVDLNTMINKIRNFINEDIKYNYILSETVSTYITSAIMEEDDEETD